MSGFVVTKREVLLAMQWLYQNKIRFHQKNLYQDIWGAIMLGSVAQTRPEDIGAACILGCSEIVITSHYLRQEAMAVLRRIVSQDSGLDLVAWNDTPGRTRKDVLHLIQRALDSIPSE